ncbi:MAG TPA: zinc ribbon domain-containing protein [Steroidobacteraceae bacterium]|nr:zinc ribbon domain-containing protein [Steroidobacteraceae bacterium]
MPIYEYQCDHCGHHLEALQKISDKPLRECPECGRHRLKRLMSAPLFRLAGSGWYETDFKSDKEQKRNLLEKGDKEPAPEAKAEAKPEGKAEAKAPEKTVVPAAKPVATPAGAARPRAAKSAARSSAKAPVRKKAPARARKR